MNEEDANRRGLPDTLVATLADPAGHAARVPYLLGLLDGEDPDVRLAAGTALCLVAGTDERLREVVAERLVDRLDADAPVEVAHTVNYLRARYPDTVEEAVSTLGPDAQTRVAERLAAVDGTAGRPTTGIGPDRTVVRTDDEVGAESDDTAADDGLPDRSGSGPTVHVRGDTPGQRGDRHGRDEGSRHGTGDRSGDRTDERNRDRTDERNRDRTGSEDGDDAGAARNTAGVTAETLRTVSRRLSAVVEASEFDDLTVLSEGRRDRYGDVYRAAGRLDGRDYAVALTVYRERGTHASFVGAFRRVMEAWREVSDHRAVLPVYDWSPRPRPWAAIEYAGGSLATHGDPTDTLSSALELASAVAHAHQHGVVHGAIDPGNVVYRDVDLDGTDHQPLLANVGVASLPDEPDDGTGSTLSGDPEDRTGADTPGEPGPWGVDPRYAAPEHYDDDYGRIDAATDVYCLGALCFRLLTGEHPYSGDSTTLRERVLSGPRPLPGRVDPALPAALDDVLRKATARRKIKRYETVTAFERELQQVADGMGSEGGDV